MESPHHFCFAIHVHGFVSPQELRVSMSQLASSHLSPAPCKGRSCSNQACKQGGTARCILDLENVVLVMLPPFAEREQE